MEMTEKRSSVFDGMNIYIVYVSMNTHPALSRKGYLFFFYQQILMNQIPETSHRRGSLEIVLSVE